MDSKNKSNFFPCFGDWSQHNARFTVFTRSAAMLDATGSTWAICQERGGVYCNYCNCEVRDASR